MEVWPAIDLRNNKCVRLSQGDFDRETIYGDDPVAVAKQFQAQGAKHLHLVDLDAAKAGTSDNRETIAAIVAAVDMECELGGGIRDDASIEASLALGLARLVVGTSAIANPDWFRAACKKWPNKLVLGLDAREGKVATQGWLETSEQTALEVALSFVSEPLAAIVYTDIATDGMMQGPNVAETLHLANSIDVPVVASGGVTTIDDVLALKNTSVVGAIVGRALYEKTISLEEAVQVAKR